jgi:enoyl-CoA hydratase/carnithine racemase
MEMLLKYATNGNTPKNVLFIILRRTFETRFFRILLLTSHNFFRSTDFFVTARRFDAPDALRMGFVSRVCAGSEIDAVVDQYTKMIGENAPLTVAASKFNIRQVCAHPEEQDMDRAVQMVKNCFASEDFKEGRTAFMEKRPAQFKGR